MPSLLPYQEEGIEWLLQHPRAILADQMGLGKTAQAISLARTTKSDSTLVLCPASLVLNWHREMDMWWRDGSYQVIPYSQLKKYKTDLAQFWGFLVLDESHYLKNPKAKRTRHAFGFRQWKGIQASRVVALTGTPLVNRPMELYPLLNFLHPGQWGSRHAFGLRYCGGWKAPWGWDYSGATSLDELRGRLQTVMLRRTKDEVLTELPEKRRQVIELPGHTRGDVLVRKWDEAVDPSMSFEEAMSAFRKSKVDFSSASALRRQQGEEKLPFVTAHLEDAIASSGKVVCFAHHRSVLESLCLHFSHCAVLLYGGMSAEAKQKAVDIFQNDPKCKLFIGQIQSAGVGLTLTASSHVVFAELDWAPMDQAEDRCHRIGQQGSVLVQYLVQAGTVEARAAHLLAKKGVVARRILDELTTEEKVERMMG